VAHTSHPCNLLSGGRTGLAYVNVLVAVRINVDNGNARAPAVGRSNASSFSYILKMPVPFVQVKAVIHEVTSEINILKSVAVEVAKPYPTAVIEIAISVRIQLFGVVQFILKPDARSRVASHLSKTLVFIGHTRLPCRGGIVRTGTQE
jgi:hypothetical protein